MIPGLQNFTYEDNQHFLGAVPQALHDELHTVQWAVWGVGETRAQILPLVTCLALAKLTTLHLLFLIIEIELLVPTS